MARRTTAWLGVVGRVGLSLGPAGERDTWEWAGRLWREPTRRWLSSYARAGVWRLPGISCWIRGSSEALCVTRPVLRPPLPPLSPLASPLHYKDMLLWESVRCHAETDDRGGRPCYIVMVEGSPGRRRETFTSSLRSVQVPPTTWKKRGHLPLGVCSL
ncbi:hypothetical protein E2C01_045607 [Portunus trituberculatus]|uniref:Uncharacterized protein n=1 Tax=Portunus trituberculatus TaxID=210409 RepID=A0A5B7G5I2_PORTR|nr:hypothetical protein [Portunus trituberculatus]